MRKTPTRQEAFDMAARHLLAQGRPSGITNKNGGFDCKYSGTGCALRPFIPDDVDPEDWDREGGIGGLVTSDLQEQVPEFIPDDLNFYADLQDAHDSPAIVKMGSPAAWLRGWIDEMTRLAKKYDLDDSIVRKGAA